MFTLAKAVTGGGVFWVLKHPAKLFAIFLVSHFSQLAISSAKHFPVVVAQYQTEIHAGMHKTHHFEIKNGKDFLRRGTPPPQIPPPSARRSSRLRAQAQFDTP